MSQMTIISGLPSLLTTLVGDSLPILQPRWNWHSGKVCSLSHCLPLLNANRKEASILTMTIHILKTDSTSSCLSDPQFLLLYRRDNKNPPQKILWELTNPIHCKCLAFGELINGNYVLFLFLQTLPIFQSPPQWPFPSKFPSWILPLPRPITLLPLNHC